ncbi:unnamed protein product [Caenorhabditis brenneri]
MYKLAVLVLALLVKDTIASCQCYETSNYTGKSAAISNAYETADFSSCAKNCSYTAYSGDDTYGWTGLTFQWGTTTNSGGLVEIFDGATNDSSALLIQIQEGENVLSGSTKSQIKSSSPRITIRYTQSAGAANVYYGVIKAVPGLQPSAAPITTTAAPTTRTFSNPNFKHDPYLITHDAFILINQKTSGGVSALNNLNAIAINFVSLLAVTTDASSTSSTRLSLGTLTPYDPFYSLKGPIWEMAAGDVIASVPRSGVTIDGNIDKALSNLVDLAFTVNKNETADSRRNVQRSIILLTAEWPAAGATLSDDVRRNFSNKGVDLLVVGYNLSSSEQSQLLRSDLRWYNAINTMKTDQTGVASFVNPFYFNDGSSSNYWCPPVPITNSIDNKYVWFQEPHNYNGPTSLTDTWKTHDPYYGQTARYCNFANNAYTYNLPSGFQGITVQVFFELEAGKDFLNFYDASNNLIASFTGYEISASTFYTETPTLRAQFISDNQSVFRGFYVSITPVPKTV